MGVTMCNCNITYLSPRMSICNKLLGLLRTTTSCPDHSIALIAGMPIEEVYELFGHPDDLWSQMMAYLFDYHCFNMLTSPPGGCGMGGEPADVYIINRLFSNMVARYEVLGLHTQDMRLNFSQVMREAERMVLEDNPPFKERLDSFQVALPILQASGTAVLAASLRQHIVNGFLGRPVVRVLLTQLLTDIIGPIAEDVLAEVSKEPSIGSDE